MRGRQCACTSVQLARPARLSSYTHKVAPDCSVPAPGFREAAEAARQRLVAIAADNKDDPEVRAVWVFVAVFFPGWHVLRSPHVRAVVVLPICVGCSR